MLRRAFSTDIRSTLKAAIPKRVEQLQALRKSEASLGELTVGATIGGMRGYKALFWQSSQVDADLGVTFHGKTISDCQGFLPKCKDELNDPNSEFLPESMFWFLLTGSEPTQQQIDTFSAEIASKSTLPDYLIKILDSLPTTLHPMTQLSIAISALNNDSQFARAYEKGIPKSDYWEYTLEDSINLISKLPGVIGKIYSNTYFGGKTLGELDTKSKDWSHNMATVLGYTQDSANVKNLSASQSQDFINLIRLYCALHADHEGGNVSAHATHLVGSALSDAYLSYSSGVQGLAGPLHGLAAQEVVRFIVEMKKNVTDINDKKQIEDYLWSLLNSKRVIPGYGHGVLRKPDPRFKAMMQFGFNRPDEFKGDDYFNLVNNLSNIAPGVLKDHGKTKNPFPNVDSSSGILFYHYGLTELLFFTVIFGGSRSMGPLAQLVWDRIYGLPIERPKSVTLEMLQGLK